MSLLLETNLGDLVIDLDLEGSPALCRNVLKLAKARYYTNTLIYNVQPGRFCQLGDPRGDGTGGSCIYGLLDTMSSSKEDVTQSQKRFLRSQGRLLSAAERREKGRVVAVEMNGIPDTIGSQFLMTISEGHEQALDGFAMTSEEATSNVAAPTNRFLSLGVVAEDDNSVLDKIHAAYCDADGRPFADIRIIRALVIHDPFDDPPGMDELLQQRGVVVNGENVVTASPQHDRPPEEIVERRIQAEEVQDELEEDEGETREKAREREEQIREKEDKSRAVVLEMLGDLPSAEIKTPENVLFVCKLNPVTDDEDLELIFSRFDPSVKAEIIRDAETGASLQYAFVEFTKKEQCVEAYFKMNNALVDDRRIKVDFSQSVAKVWDKYAQRMRTDKQGRGGKQQQRHGGGGQQHQQRRGGGGGSGYGRNNHDRRPQHPRDEQPRYNRDTTQQFPHHHGGRPDHHQSHRREDDTGDRSSRRSRWGPHSNDRTPHGNESRRHEWNGHRDEYQNERERRSRSPSRSLENRSDSRSVSRSPSWERKRRKKDHHHKKRHGHERRRRHHHDEDDRRGHHRRHKDDRHGRERRDRDRERTHREDDDDARRHERKHRKKTQKES